MQNIMAQARKIQGEVEKLTKEINEKEFTYKNENVEVSFSGDNKLKSIKILDDGVLSDSEMLEDVLFVAINDVLEQIRKEKESKLGKYTGGMGGLF